MRSLIAGASALLLLVGGLLTSADALEVLAHVGDLVIPAGTIVRGDAIAIAGHLDVQGTVEGDAIASGGGVTVGGRVNGSVRAIGGDVHLRSTAVVGGTVAAWGGEVTRDPGASVGGGQQSPAPGPSPVPPPGVPFPVPGPIPRAWPGWWLPGVFAVVAAVHLLYWVIILVALASFVAASWLTAILFPHTLTSLASELERAPAATFAVGLIGWIVLWPIVVVLAMSVIGLALVVLIPAAILIMLQFGTTAVALLAGRRIRPSSIGREALVGSVVLSVAFAIPHLGWLLGLAVATWGWGVVLRALFGWARARPLPPPPAPA